MQAEHNTDDPKAKGKYYPISERSVEDPTWIMTEVAIAIGKHVYHGEEQLEDAQELHHSTHDNLCVSLHYKLLSHHVQRDTGRYNLGKYQEREHKADKAHSGQQMGFRVILIGRRNGSMRRLEYRLLVLPEGSYTRDATHQCHR